MMGRDGLRDATQVAILNANYVARRLADHYPVLYTGQNGMVAHECIIDLRAITSETGVTVDDVAKRLIDYGFHAPTMSFPVAGTLMIEPTESESKVELDRFCDAMIAIRAEIDAVASGTWSVEDNPLRHAPHTAADVLADEWTRPYGRELAAFPGARRASRQVLPAGGAHRRRLRRPQRVLQLSGLGPPVGKPPAGRFAIRLPSRERFAPLRRPGLESASLPPGASPSAFHLASGFVPRRLASSRQASRRALR